MASPLFFARMLDDETKANYQVPVIAVDMKEETALILHKRVLQFVPFSKITWDRWA